ncbi:MAG TPA: efflux RND transporter permease subunit [Dongiaceae bacterium]|jgi:HAE1 family hydrophobic/amphiphilic exporter-1|nr:efflux RND transporter permease subunit [Dongiaceae bacterium]
MIAKFFIDRPVLANVLAILFVLIGLVALFTLPVAQYPNVTPPTISVTTRYPGASAATVMNTVALPIEQQVNGVQHMLYMQSTSAADGTYSLTVTFDIGTDLNFAQVLVQNRVSSALSQLPTPVQNQGVTVQQKSTSILEIVTLTSPDKRYDSLYLSNYATINLVNELARLPGVGNVNVFGVGQYSMRIWLDPQRLQARGLVPQDVINVIQSQSQEVAAGQTGAPPAPADQSFQYTVKVAGRFDSVDQFSNIIVKTASNNGGEVTRLRDVARVELGAQTYSQGFRLNNDQAAGIAIYQSADANALNVAGEVKAKLAELAKAFPAGMTSSVPFDTTKFVHASVAEVYKTLIEAGVLVLVVILIFLQDWRATLVPATTVPVTIIGAFAAMAALGFTINLSTLFAIVLAIGIVVDDAIVVVEGAASHIERGLNAHDAAVKAMGELFGPIIGITLVLMSVFIPAAFLPGLTGQMYAQFALVIAATALISAINAATLKPTQCALWLRRPKPPEQRNFFYRGFNYVYGKFERAYVALIGHMARVSLVMVAIALIAVAFGGWGIARLPTAFIPPEDQGYFLVAVQLPDGASLERTQNALAEVDKIVRAIPGVDQAVEIAGISPLDNSASLSSAGAVYVILKDWGERLKQPDQDLRGLYFKLQAAVDKVSDGTALVILPPPIQGIGNSAGFTMIAEMRDGSVDFPKLASVANTMVRAAAGQSALQRTATTIRAQVPQLLVSVDRTKAESLQVNVGDVFAALSSYLGSSFVNQFNKFGRTFQVYVQGDAKFRLTPRDIESLYVRSQSGALIPLGSLAQIKPVTGPSLVTLYNLYPAATILGGPAQGFSSGEAIDVMEQLASSAIPSGMAYEWTAMSYQEKVVGHQIYYVFALALLLVYLCLAGQYESWIAPLAVILAVPLALIGPVLVLNGLGLANNLYTQIGLMLLIALSAKNAILIVEMAREHRLRQGQPIIDSAIAAARSRFRPILMTSFAFILGVVPLVTATGAGANARASLGISVFSGMLASTCLAVLFVPSFFVVLQRLEERVRKPKPGAAAAKPA